MKAMWIRLLCGAVVACVAVPLGGCRSAAKEEKPAAVGNQTPEDGKLQQTLKVRWFDRLPTHGVLNVYLLADSLYIDTIEGVLYRYDRVKGGLVWGGKTLYPLDGPPTRDGKGRLYAMAGGKLIIIDEDNGGVLARRRIVMGPLKAIFPTAEALIYAGTDSSMHIVNPATGYDMILPQRIGANVLSVESSSLELVHMILDTGYAACYFSNTARPSWKTEIGPKPIAGLGLYDPYVLVGGMDYYVRAIGAHAGRELWKVPVGGVAVDKPKLSRDRVFVVTNDGSLHCLSIENGRQLWKDTLKDCVRFLTADDHYVIAERDQKRIVVADAKTGEEIAVTRPKRYAFLDADPGDGLFYTVSQEGFIACLQTQTPPESVAATAAVAPEKPKP